MLIMVVLSPLPVTAQGPVTTIITGGGAGTFGADLDGDGDTDGSRFGLGVVMGEKVQGHFECLMAGQSDILGPPLMALEGRVISGSTTVRAL